MTAALTTKVHFSALCDPALGPMTLRLKESVRLPLRPIDQCEIRGIVHSQIGCTDYKSSKKSLDFILIFPWIFRIFLIFRFFVEKKSSDFSDFCTFESSKKISRFLKFIFDGFFFLIFSDIRIFAEFFEFFGFFGSF